MQDWLFQIMNTYGYLGIALLIMIENIFPPIPSEVILTFSGFMTTYTKMHIPGAVLSATVGSVAGAILLYEAGSLLSQEKMESILSGRVGKILHLKKEDVGKAMEWFDSKGNYTVLLCRFIPIVRSLISIPAGTAKMELGRFLCLTAIGSLLWNLVLISVGAAAGASWKQAMQYFGSYTSAARIVIVLFSIVGILVFIKRRFWKKK